MKAKKICFLAIFMFIGAILFSGGTSEGKLEEDSFSFTGIDRLSVKGDFFEVDITGHSKEALEAKVIIPARLSERGVKVFHEIKGSELHVWVEKPLVSINILPSKRPQMIFRVPIETDVEVKNSSGSVSVEGLMSRQLRIEVSSGKLHIKDITSALHVISSSGNIKIEDCNGNKSLRASSGQITVLDSNGDIKTKTSSGKQTYEYIKGSITAESSSGKINISNQEGVLDLEASSGSLKGRDVHITGDSSFQTSSGTIDFDFTNSIISEFSFDLKSTSGTIAVGRTRAEGSVVTGNGKILIRAKSTSGSQTYK